MSVVLFRSPILGSLFGDLGFVFVLPILLRLLLLLRITVYLFSRYWLTTNLLKMLKPMLTIFTSSAGVMLRILRFRTLRFLALCLFCVSMLLFAPSCSRHLSVSLRGEQVEFNLSENDSLQYSGKIFGKKE